jgi:hypothetical protein
MMRRRIGWTLSLAALMTGCAVWSLISGTWLWEFAPPPSVDDDWLWLLLPAGAALGLGLWLSFRRRVWIHFVGPIAVATLAASIFRMLSLETPEGMEGLGISIGKLLAVAVAVISGGVAIVCLFIAIAVVALVTSRER